MVLRPLVAVILLFAVVACGDDGGDGGQPAQPAPDVTVFVEGDFGSIPLVPDSREAGERQEENSEVTQSFVVPDRTPRDVISYYEQALRDQWATLGEPEEIGADAWKAEWEYRGSRLTVTAATDPLGEELVEGQPRTVTQYSLHLH